MKHLYYDAAIAGCGVAGLYTALHLPSDKKILLLSKGSLDTCDSMLAQGGICVLRDDDDYDSYFEDTMRAGHYENRRESVDIIIRGSRAVIDHLLRLGVRFAKNPDGRYFYATTKAPHAYHEAEYRDGDYLMFGKETKGLPESLLVAHPERCVRIPMREGARSLNLSNSVAVIVFEALRQTGFANLKLAGPFPQE